MARKIEKFLSDSKFPFPERWVTDLHDFLVQIMDNEVLECSLRVKAAFELGTLNGLKITQSVSLLLKTHMASKLALDRYARYAPQSTLALMGFE